MRHSNPFKQQQLHKNLSEDDLPHAAQKRFLELKVILLMRKLERLYKNGTFTPTSIRVADILGIEDPAFHNIVTSHSFQDYRKEDMIDMLRYNDVSYRNIQRITSVSPNLIAQRRFITPNVTPERDHFGISPVYMEWRLAHRNALKDIQTQLNYFEK